MKPRNLFILLISLFMITSAGLCSKDKHHCPGFTVQISYDGMETLTAQINGGQAPYTYTWKGTGTATGPLFIINGPGVYEVSAVDLDKCEAKAIFTVQ